MALQPLVEPWPLFQFLNRFTKSVGLLGCGFGSSQGRYLHRTTWTQNEHTQTSMPWVGFEAMIPAFEQAKTVHASCRHDRHQSTYRLQTINLNLSLRVVSPRVRGVSVMGINLMGDHKSVNSLSQKPAERNATNAHAMRTLPNLFIHAK
jgi:hypothetical protein